MPHFWEPDFYFKIFLNRNRSTLINFHMNGFIWMHIISLSWAYIYHSSNLWGSLHKNWNITSYCQSLYRYKLVLQQILLSYRQLFHSIPWQFCINFFLSSLTPHEKYNCYITLKSHEYVTHNYAFLVIVLGLLML